MTRKECELKLLALAEQMQDVYKDYRSMGDILTVSIGASGNISIFDGFFSGGQLILDASDRAYSTVHVTKYANGKVRFRNAS